MQLSRTQKKLLKACLLGVAGLVLTHLVTPKQQRYERHLKRIRKRRRDADAHANTIYHQFRFNFQLHWEHANSMVRLFLPLLCIAL